MSGIFSVCRQVYKTNRVSNDALFVKWCLLECLDFVDMPNMLGCYNMRFRQMSPLSLIVITWGCRSNLCIKK